jgi:transposase
MSRYYDEEFKRNALELVAAGRPVSQVSRELGLSNSAIYRWQQQLGVCGGVTSKVPDSVDLGKEVKRLQHENQILRQEREILKKATAFFASQK